MNRKKIIAREFLYFIACITFTLITLLTIYSYNKFLDYKISEQENLKNPIFEDVLYYNSKYQTKRDNRRNFITHIFEKIQNREIPLFLNDYDVNENWKKLENHVKNNSLKIRWEKKWDKQTIYAIKDFGINNSQELKSFILQNLTNEEEKKDNIKLDISYKKINKIDRKINLIKKSKVKMTPYTNLISLSIKTFSIFFLILFVLRHAINGVKWSIKTLKQ